MYNDLFSIGPLTFHTYGLMTAIGIISAYYMIEARGKKRNFTEEQSGHIFGLVAFCVLFGYIGSKLLFMLTILPELMQDPSRILQSISDGWVVFGGILGGIFGAWIFCKWKKLPAGEYFDLAFPGVALAQGFGRIGCFFAGCCYGAQTESAFSIVFKNSDYAPNHVHLIPTQLISSALDFLLCFFLLWYEKRIKKRDGELAAVYLVLYSVGRFILEFWRGDLGRGSVGNLSTSQFIGIFTALAGVGLYLFIRRRPGAARVEEQADADRKADVAARDEAVTDVLKKNAENEGEHGA